MSRRETAIIAGLLVLSIGGLIWAGRHLLEQRAQTTSEATGPALIVSEFELIDQDGRPVRGQGLRDKLQLVFFGFTSCPDLCPTTLTNITAALEELGPDADLVHPLLMTVDPARDTPAALKEYLGSFDPRIVGLTGSPEQVAAALKSFRVYASRRDLEGGDYTMDHSTFIYLMGKNGDYLAHFSASGDVEALAAGIRKAIAES